MTRRKQLGKCPVCGESLDVTRLSCPNCETIIEGRFETCRFCQLPLEQREFVETFIKCRGNIKEVERELGISYPTVRNRLDNVIQALGYPVEAVEDEEAITSRRRQILEALDRGEISPDDALKALKRQK
ncbi:MAG TPA: DUF2089 domain-containing protein [Firmicutes bacterium]|nr:DUF2089 domain-containing protein [Bacillota bacterium]